MDLRQIGKPVPVTKQGSSYYALIPVYLRNRTEMRFNLPNIADCVVTYLEDPKTREVHVRIAPPEPVREGE